MSILRGMKVAAMAGFARKAIQTHRATVHRYNGMGEFVDRPLLVTERAVACVGAAVVYSVIWPIYMYSDMRDFEIFITQRTSEFEIETAVATNLVDVWTHMMT